MDPEAVGALQALADCYRDLKSYRDEGIVRTWLGGRDQPVEMTFSTIFRAPRMFRFEFISPHPYPPLSYIKTRHVVGSDGERAYFLTQEHEKSPVLERRELSLAVAAATGVSKGAAHTIARLLMPWIGGRAIWEMDKLSMAGGSFVEDEPCLRIEGLVDATAMAVFVDSVEPRLRQIKASRERSRSEETRRKIQIDVDLDESLFRIPL